MNSGAAPDPDGFGLWVYFLSLDGMGGDEFVLGGVLFILVYPGGVGIR